jgi:hypothetical protein
VESESSTLLLRQSEINLTRAIPVPKGLLIAKPIRILRAIGVHLHPCGKKCHHKLANIILMMDNFDILPNRVYRYF